jgi:hypothetical protein
MRSHVHDCIWRKCSIADIHPYVSNCGYSLYRAYTYTHTHTSFAPPPAPHHLSSPLSLCVSLSLCLSLSLACSLTVSNDQSGGRANEATHTSTSPCASPGSVQGVGCRGGGRSCLGCEVVGKTFGFRCTSWSCSSTHAHAYPPHEVHDQVFQVPSGTWLLVVWC